MIYALMILWVALFVYLAERQFKKIKGEEFRQDDYVSIFGRLKQKIQKKTKEKQLRQSKKKVDEKKPQPKNIEKIGEDISHSVNKKQNVKNMNKRGQLIMDVYRANDIPNDRINKNTEIKVLGEEVGTSHAVLVKLPNSNVNNKVKTNKNNFRVKAVGWILMLIAILPPSIIAGIKNYDVGLDRRYVEDAVYNAQESSNFVDYFNRCSSGDHSLEGVEKGYLSLAYILTQIIADPHFLLFVLQFLTILLVALFAYEFRDIADMTFVMTIYMFVWYLFTFTMKRQSLAIALIMYSMTFFRKKQYIRTLILFLIAVMIHKSSVVAIGIYILMFISQSKIKPKNKTKIYSTCSIIILLATLCFFPLLNLFTNVVPLLPEKYANYLTTYRSLEFESRGSEVLPLIVYVITSIIYLFIFKKRKSRVDMGFVLMLLLVDLAFTILNLKITNLYRLGLYYYYPAIMFLFPNVPRMAKKKQNRFALAVACIIFLSVIWIYKYPLQNEGDVYPYKSDILHISAIDDIKLARHE